MSYGLPFSAGGPNLIPYPDFSSGWGSTRLTGAPNQADPDGGTDALKIAVQNGETNGLLQTAALAKPEAVRVYVGSVWAKADGRTWLWLRLADTLGSKRVDAYFDIGSGALGTTAAATFELLGAAILDRGDGWHQCVVAARTDDDDGIRLQLYPADGDLDTNFSDSDGQLGVLLFRPEIREGMPHALRIGERFVPVVAGSHAATHEPLAVETRRNVRGVALAGITSARGYRRRWRFTTPPLGATEAEELEAELTTGLPHECSGFAVDGTVRAYVPSDSVNATADGALRYSVSFDLLEAM